VGAEVSGEGSAEVGGSGEGVRVGVSVGGKVGVAVSSPMGVCGELFGLRVTMTKGSPCGAVAVAGEEGVGEQEERREQRIENSKSARGVRIPVRLRVCTCLPVYMST
jgi:hypothetical protein